MDDKSVERTDGPTPNGGAYFLAIFHDGNGNPMTRMTATHVRIEEYSEEDVLILVHHAYLGEPDSEAERYEEWGPSRET
jgi:hypothetical protein